MSKIRTALIRIEIVLIILTLFFSLTFIFFHSILPAFEIDVCWDVSGISMSPTITEGALVIGKRVPYEELQVGDIITFKMIDHINQTVDENGQAYSEAVYLDNENNTHRIISIDAKGIHTKGDNADVDFYPCVYCLSLQKLQHLINTLTAGGDGFKHPRFILFSLRSRRSLFSRCALLLQLLQFSLLGLQFSGHGLDLSCC